MTNSIENYTIESKRESILRLLEEYNAGPVKINDRTKEICCRCVIHDGDNPHALNINFDKMVYNCYTHCGGGRIIDMICKVEKCNFIHATRKMSRLLGHSYNTNSTETIVKDETEYTIPISESDELEKILEEQTIQARYYRGFSQHVLSLFEIRLGRPSTRFADQVVVPIRDSVGRLVSLKLRDMTGKAKQRYMSYPSGSCKSRLLYNYHNIDNPYYCIVVEGEFKVIKLWEFGLQSVAIMGSAPSDFQTKMLLDFETIICFNDGDEAGDSFARKLVAALQKLDRIENVYTMGIAGFDPDEIERNVIMKMIGFA